MCMKVFRNLFLADPKVKKMFSTFLQKLQHHSHTHLPLYYTSFLPNSSSWWCSNGVPHMWVYKVKLEGSVVGSDAYEVLKQVLETEYFGFFEKMNDLLS
ncbi:hypothetical protein DEO72_LG10g2197 [Vigna unguiculata]|uniref:Uncharacterized protein n=1 Tax=Vigna unguiculata TaxID=3917 RepID=A0A4D6NDZ5_VIGUN|nr:hypothetical protein DEO72_LG10g2197 [Vigna unguiculata]